VSKDQKHHLMHWVLILWLWSLTWKVIDLSRQPSKVIVVQPVAASSLKAAEVMARHMTEAQLPSLDGLGMKGQR
jgi:hypothetical protein